MGQCNQQFLGTNQGGIPFFTVNSVQVRETSVDLALGFRSNFPPVGYMTINIATAIPEGTTGTLPIRLTLNNNTRELVFFGGNAVTAADIEGTGVILVFHNAFNGGLQLVSALPTSEAATTENTNG